MDSKIADEVRIRVGLRILLGGALIGFWEAALGWYFEQPWTLPLGVAAGVCMLILTQFLRHTRSLDLTSVRPSVDELGRECAGFDAAWRTIDN